MENIPYILNSMNVTWFLILTGVLVASVSSGITAIAFIVFRKRYWLRHVGAEARLELRDLKRERNGLEYEVGQLRQRILRMAGAQKAAIAILHDSHYAPDEEEEDG